MGKKFVPKKNWYVYGVVTTSVCWYVRSMVANVQRWGWKDHQECVLIDTRQYYRKGLRVILRQDKFVQLSLYLSIYSLIKYIYTKDFKQYTKSYIEWVKTRMKEEKRWGRGRNGVRNKANWVDVSESWQTLKLFYIFVWKLNNQLRSELKLYPLEKPGVFKLMIFK